MRLNDRLKALEGKADNTMESMTIIRRIVAPGNLHPDYNHIRADDGQAWTRQPGEPEQEFTDRASREVKRNQWGNAQIIMDEVNHAIN
jgi:hypothetical protein